MGWEQAARADHREGDRALSNLVDLIRNAGMTRITAVVAGTALMMGLLIFLIFSGAKPNMALLYNDLTPDNATRIVEQLTSRQIDYTLSNDQTRISVPRDQVAQLRLEFAEQGLSGHVGYDLFDRDESLGQSSFTQEINRLRALEGELSRTIASISNVRGARVHIVLPRRELFTRDTQDATASVILKMRGANRLDRGQVAAILQLVATAVPQLNPQRITIVDDRGTLLHGGGDVEDGMGPEAFTDMRSGFESSLSGKVTEMLERVIGIGKVRVEVTAEMDFTQEVQNIHSFDPEQQVVVSSREIEDVSQSQDAAEENVTIGNNLPDAGGFPGQAGSSESESRTDTITNFQTGNTRTERIVPAGRVERLSVAVIVDGVRLDDGTYQERIDEEMEKLRSLAEAAIGFDPARGDNLTIEQMRFEDVPVFAPLDSEELFGIPLERFVSWGQTAIIGVVVLLIALLIVRPLITRLFDLQQQAAAQRAAAADQPNLLTDQSGAMVAAGADGAMVPMDGGGGAEEFESMIDIAHIEGRVKASSLKKVGEIIEKHPEEAVSILRTWMYQESN
jgi:flagellar M-ring protein FliF